MAYIAPVNGVPGDLITAATWNQDIVANWASLSGLIAYVQGATPLSGWVEFTGARGMFILGLPSGGTVYNATGPVGTVGTALTNVQNVTHTHSVPYNGWGVSSIYDDPDAAGQVIIGSSSGTGPGVGKRVAANNTSGTAAAGSIGVPYIQLLCQIKS